MICVFCQKETSTSYTIEHKAKGAMVLHTFQGVPCHVDCAVTKMAAMIRATPEPELVQLMTDNCAISTITFLQ